MLNGRYRLERRLGGGTMGTVWEAFDIHLERTVAVKELIPGPFADEDAATRRERVKREATALAQVEHPVIVTVHDLISVGRSGVPWIVMGYVPGRPLSEIIGEQKDAPLPEQKIAAIALAVLDGLRACHTSRPRVYHRDVKPGNIVVGPDGSVHLVDFGIARIAGKVPLTDDRAIVGTPEFLAPELLDGEPAGPGTDLWALGVTLYYALTGEAPFSAETKWAMFTAIKFRNPPEPREGGPLASLVLQMLRKRPEDRPDAATVSAVLRGVASQPDPPSTPSFRPDLQEPPARQEKTAQPIGTGPRLTALSGLPVLTQAQIVAGMPTDKAAGELLALSRHEAARIINRCDDALGGNLLSAIAIGGEPPAGDRDARERAATARSILQMLPPDRHGPLLDHMSSDRPGGRAGPAADGGDRAHRGPGGHRERGWRALRNAPGPRRVAGDGDGCRDAPPGCSSRSPRRGSPTSCGAFPRSAGGRNCSAGCRNGSVPPCAGTWANDPACARIAGKR